MKEQFINKVCGNMTGIIDENQLLYLKNVMYSHLDYYNITSQKNEVAHYTNDDEIINMFIVAKKIDGLSDRSLKNYSSTLKKYLHMYIQKPVSMFTKDDLRMHFARRMIDNPQISKCYINIERRIFSSFFSWLTINEYIQKNPMVAVKNIKVDKVIKEPYTEREIEKMRDYLTGEIRKHKTKNNRWLKCVRDLAIFEFLLSTGCRVSELTGAKLSDLSLKNKECKVFGKGSKERVCYLNELATIRLEEWFEARGEDGTPYVFVGTDNRRMKLEVSGVGTMVRAIGKKVGVKAHPHKFRRTCATTLLNKGMPIEQVKIVLGHNQIDTTLIYAQTNKKTVKLNHEKYM